MLYHRYELDAERLIRAATIVPPIAQNQDAIEEDLRWLVSQNLHLDDLRLTALCEQAIRNYDPCISCSTHFLRPTHRAPMTPPWAAVIGIGNELRRDDGIGPVVAAEVQRREIPGLRVVISHGEPIGLLDAWADVRLAVAVDAVLCEPSEPGRFHRRSGGTLPPPTGTAGTHGFGIPEAWELGRVLDRVPQQLIVYAVEVLDLSVGLGLSAPLAATVSVLVEAVREELDQTRTGQFRDAATGTGR